MAPFRELPATTASAASAMTAETDKSAFPYQAPASWEATKVTALKRNILNKING